MSAGLDAHVDGQLRSRRPLARDLVREEVTELVVSVTALADLCLARDEAQTWELLAAVASRIEHAADRLWLKARRELRRHERTEAA